MLRFISRLWYGLLFAIPIMFITYALAEAANRPQEAPTDQLNCRECHEPFVQAWEVGSHGQATSDPAFREAWMAAGQSPECLSCHVTGYDEETNTWKSDGITCEACHSPITLNHPLAPMSSDRSANMCGDCHTETFFEWQISGHRNAGVSCSACHDPHATDLKTTDKTLVCADCHRNRQSNFAHSQHSQAGLTCGDCHLQKISETGNEGKAKQSHSFIVGLTTCNSCHSYQMHDPVEVHPDASTPEPADAMSAVESLSVTPEPIPVSPMGYTTLSGLIGVAFGVILAPYIERISRRNRDDKEEE